MQIIGKLVHLLPEVTGNGKNGLWKKQEFILETDGTYPKKICIEVWGEKIDMAVLQLGNELDVQFDVESREYNNKWFTNCKAWKVAVVGSGTAPAKATNTAAPTTNYSDINQSMQMEGDDDLPF